MTEAIASIVAHPEELPVLTVLVHPEQDPAAADALRVMRTTLQVAPWVPITGKGIEQQHHRLDNGVVGWRVQSFAAVLAALNGEVR